MSDAQLICGDCLEVMKTLPANSVQTCITSPPYFGLRSYLDSNHADKPLEIGTEETPEAYVARLVEVFREVKRVLRDDGTLWLNLGDSYANDTKWGGQSGGLNMASALSGDVGQRVRRNTGLKPKDLIGIPWMTAFALRADGWYLRSEIIWAKRAPMPESCRDRPTKAHEQLFLLAKSASYFYDHIAIAEESAPSSLARSRYNNGTPNPKNFQGVVEGVYAAPKSTARMYGQGRNKRSVWTLGPNDPLCRLRSDLTPEQRAYVLQRIAAADSLSSSGNTANST